MPESRVAAPRVKICGLRDSQHALAAARAGADYLGFNFVEGVRRQLQQEEAAAIVKSFTQRWAEVIAGMGVSRQAVGQRHSGPTHGRQAEATSGASSRPRTQHGNGGSATRPAKEGADTPRLVGLFRNQPVDWVRETVGRVELDIAHLCGEEDLAYAEALGLPVMRQVRVKPGQSAAQVRDEVRAWLNAGYMVVLDAFDPTTPGGAGVSFDWTQAAEAISEGRVLLAGGLTPENVEHAVGLLHPWGVDVSSGVETGGVKDPKKIQAFIRTAKHAT